MPQVPDSPPSSRYLSVAMLMRLGRVTGHRFDIERIAPLLDKVTGRADRDPIAHLAIAAKDLGLRVTSALLPLTEAVWHANIDEPVVFWCEAENRYLIVSYASSFAVRIAIYDQPDVDAITISRAKLAQRLGLADVSQRVEVGMIHAASPEEAASIDTQHHAEEIAARYGARSNHPVETSQLPRDASHGHGKGRGISPIVRFFKLLRPERRDILLLIVFAVLSGVLYLSLPFAVDIIVSNLAFGTQSKPYIQALLTIAQILAIALLLQAVIIGFQYFVAELIQRRMFVRTAADIAYRLPRVKASSLDAIHGPELINRFLDIVTLQKNTAYFLLDGINVVAATLIGMLILTFYHPILLVFVVVLVIMTVGGTWLLGGRAVETAIDESKAKYDLVAWFEEVATFPLMFKGPGGSELAYQRTNVLATQYIDARIRHFHILFRQICGLLFLSVIATVCLLVIGTWLVLSQQITLGQLVASELIMSGIVASFLKFGKKLEAWYDTMAATDKVGHILDLETEEEFGDIPSHTDPAIGMLVEARDLAFGYNHDQLLFKHRNFTLKPGDKVALHAPQGSGVSSLLDLLFAVRKPVHGNISFDQLDARDWNLAELRQSVQLLRHDEFIDGSIIDNLRLGRSDIALEEIRDALQKVGLLDICLEYPKGLQTRLRTGGGPLSTCQRVALLVARAIVQRPRLLLMDEILDGLDEPTFKRLTPLLLGKEVPWTVVLATRMDEVKSLCNRTIELTRGDSTTPTGDPPHGSSLQP